MNYIKLVFLSIILLTVSCVGFGVDPDHSCRVDSDCEGDNICNKGLCGEDYCLEDNPNCGKGKCIRGGLDDGTNYPNDYGNQYHCKCEENAVVPEGSSLCVPTCDGYSEECTEFGLRCNMEKGRCDTKCQGEGSCQYGYGCSDGVCWKKLRCDTEEDCVVGYHCVDGLCEVDSE